jgi:hypothetical protein
MDIDEVIDKKEWISEFDKIMKCEEDGYENRRCCAKWGVKRSCIDWCRGENILKKKLCVL